MEWEDDTKPLDMISQPLCVFCSGKHTQKELLNWQFNQIEHISQKNQSLVMRHLYRYIENEIKSIKDLIHDQCKNKEKSDDEKGEC